MSDFSEEKLKQLRDKLKIKWGMCQSLQGYLHSQGVDVRPGMEALHRMMRHLEGETMEEEQVASDLRQLVELDEKLIKLPGGLDWTDEELERWKLLGDAWSVEHMVRAWDEWVENLPRPRLTKSLPELHQRMGKLTAGTPPANFADDEWLLPMRVELTEFTRRIQFQKLTVALYWEQASHNEWNELPVVARDNLLKLLKHLDPKHRKKLLGELPIEDRRRLEAMENWTPEEWAKPDPIEP